MPNMIQANTTSANGNVLARAISRTTFLAVAIAGLALAAAPAQARITCQNGYQVVDGNLIATPYCQDSLLAQVAREYGTRVSARTIRNNPLRKRDVCRLVGQDIRVQTNCNAILPSPRGGHF